MQSEPDYYEILQVHPAAEDEVIDAAFRRLARKYHPDINKEGDAARRMREINAAYEVLSDPALRADYDWRRSRGGSETTYSPTEGSVPHGRPASVKKTAGFWLRWPAVLPAGILAVILVSFPVHWGVLIVTTSAGSDESIGIWDLPPETLERLGQAFFAPLAFVGFGAKTAPVYRLHTAGLLTILWAMALGAAMMYAGTRGGYSDWGWAEFSGVVVLG